MAAACQRFGGAYENLQPRVTRQLLRALLDPTRPLTTHYGTPRGLDLHVDVCTVYVMELRRVLLDPARPLTTHFGNSWGLICMYKP